MVDVPESSQGADRLWSPIPGEEVAPHKKKFDEGQLNLEARKLRILNRKDWVTWVTWVTYVSLFLAFLALLVSPIVYYYFMTQAHEFKIAQQDLKIAQLALENAQRQSEREQVSRAMIKADMAARYLANGDPQKALAHLLKVPKQASWVVSYRFTDMELARIRELATEQEQRMLDPLIRHDPLRSWCILFCAEGFPSLEWEFEDCMQLRCWE